MLIDFSAPILDLFGRPCIEAGTGSNGTDPKNLTLATVASSALTAAIPDEPNQSAAVKVQRFGLALRVAAGGSVDLKAEEVAMLKDLIGKLYQPLVVGRAYDLLDPPKE